MARVLFQQRDVKPFVSDKVSGEITTSAPKKALLRMRHYHHQPLPPSTTTTIFYYHMSHIYYMHVFYYHHQLLRRDSTHHLLQRKSRDCQGRPPCSITLAYITCTRIHHSRKCPMGTSMISPDVHHGIVHVPQGAIT